MSDYFPHLSDAEVWADIYALKGEQVYVFQRQFYEERKEFRHALFIAKSFSSKEK